MKAVERIAGRESCITPVATPPTHAVDDLPVVAGTRVRTQESRIETATHLRTSLLAVDKRSQSRNWEPFVV
jgi:hypothetical protein